MANCCMNYLTLSGDEEQIKSLFDLVGDNFDFNKLIPLDESDRYQSLEKWGCNSIAFDVESRFDPEDGNHYCCFWTKWSPPRGIFEVIKSKFPKIKIRWDFDEPNNGIKGKWVRNPK